MRLFALETPPDGFHRTGVFDIRKDLGLLIKLNLAGFVLLVAVVFFLYRYNLFFRRTFSYELSGTGGALSAAGLLLLDIILMAVLHEAVHGLFFWIFTGRAPRVGVGPGYAYAAAPGLYLPRSHYLVVGLAPAVILTILGLAAVPFLSGVPLFMVNIFIAMNFSGAVGDLWVVAWLLAKPSAALVQDFGDRIEVYEPA